ncbi:SMC-Scp complex subunit ScpB, partial [Candidatus Woesearchaeota archaeon]|nr:SMC-Scp complex subunit ScpB [Candidatus Woesearchaeota archaeon]
MESDYKSRVEAILFTTGRFMDINEISRLCGIGSVGIIKEVIEEIKKEYASRNSALTVYEEEGKWKLSIRKEYNYLTTQLLTDSELDHGTIKTLALIAYKQPVLQSDIVKMRGNGAYDHIATL